MRGYRYRFYVDGFNVYHALKENCPHYLWLNYGRLAQNTIFAQDTLAKVIYFSAYAMWKPAQVAKHKQYVKALRSAGVETILGRFMRKKVSCHLCHRFYWTHEEKRTDVNIALSLLRDAVQDLYDRAVILSADTDLLPVIDMVHELAPEKEIGIMLPVGRANVQLTQKADFRRRMSEKLLAASQFPARLNVGGEIISRPSEWPLPPDRK